MLKRFAIDRKVSNHLKPDERTNFVEVGFSAEQNYLNLGRMNLR